MSWMMHDLICEGPDCTQPGHPMPGDAAAGARACREGLKR